MLKAKVSRSVSKNKQKAMNEVSREDVTGLYASIPTRLTRKLKIYLAESDKTLTEWIIEQIEDI